VRYRSVVPVAFLVAACAGTGGFQAEFVDACTSSTNMDEAVCECMAEKAETDLNEDEREFVLAALQDDEARTAELQTELGVDGAMRAGMFMTNVAACAIEEMEEN